MMRSSTVWLLGLSMLAGCSGMESTSDAPGGGKAAGSSGGKSSGASPATSAKAASRLIPQYAPPIADIPVPLGFKMAESMSRSFESSGARYVDHTYEGKEDKVAVDQFYRTQMPLKGWVMRGSQMIRGTFIQRYEKGSELADVTINGDENPITGHWAQVNVNVQTLGRGEPNAETDASLATRNPKPETRNSKLVTDSWTNSTKKNSGRTILRSCSRTPTASCSS